MARTPPSQLLATIEDVKEIQQSLIILKQIAERLADRMDSIERRLAAAGIK